jgi:hypothetical protein
LKNDRISKLSAVPSPPLQAVPKSFSDFLQRPFSARNQTDHTRHSFARAIAVQRGEVSDSDLKQARAAGLTDGDIVETIANVVLNIFTNYVNHVAGTVVDFPEVNPGNGQS